MIEQVSQLLSTFKGISVSDLNKVALLSRKDTKYLLSLDELPRVLEELKKYYSVLDISQRRLFQYNTTYFDTEDFALYHMHQNGKLNRLKVRARSYTESDLHFNEIKMKRNTGNTDKARINRDAITDAIDVTFEAFLDGHSPIPSGQLTKTTGVNFRRITLVDHNFTERLTIDLQLQVHSSHKMESFNNLVIIELKQDKSSTSSTVSRILRDLRIKKQGCSKYCLAVGILYNDVKKNRIKSLQRTVHRIQKGKRSN